MSFWKKWKYKNLTLLTLSLLIAFFLSQNKPFHDSLLHLGTFGYLGAFFAGILFVSTFTVATGAVILFVLAETLSPLEIGIIAGLGAVAGDFIIFRFVKDDLSKEVWNIFTYLDKGHNIKKVFHSQYFSWSLPVIGAILIASPLPDEIGVSLMGISKLKTYQFILISFLLNAVGIFLVVTASVALTQ